MAAGKKVPLPFVGGVGEGEGGENLICCVFKNNFVLKGLASRSLILDTVCW